MNLEEDVSRQTSSSVGDRSEPNPDYILGDEPIKNWSDDLLNRRTIVERLSTAILGWPKSVPLVVALVGQWGEGKTSVVNLTLQKIRERSPDAVIVEFTPWLFNSAEGLIQAFLRELEESLRDRTSKWHFLRRRTAARAWTGIRQRLSSLPSGTAFGFGVDLSGLRPGSPAIDELRRRLLLVSPRRNQTVVVVMDDIDRLASSELIITLKLMKLWNRLTGFVFLLPFDRTSVEKKLSSELRLDPLLLEKLIQVEVRLPSPSETAIGRFLDRELTRFQALYNIEYESDFAERFGALWRGTLSKRLNTLRAVNRVLNGCAFSLPIVRGDVNYADLFALEFLRFAHPRIFELIRANRDYFCGSAGDAPALMRSLNDERTQFFKQLDGSLNQHDKLGVRFLLATIFPVFDELILDHTPRRNMTEEWSRQQRIAAPDRFPFYFQLTVPEGTISDAEVKRVMSEWNSCDERDLESLVRNAIVGKKDAGRLDEFLTRAAVLADAVVDSRASKVANQLIHLEQFYSAVPSEYTSRSEFNSCMYLVVQLLSKYQRTDEIQSTILDLVRSGPMSFAANLKLFFSEPHYDVISEWSHINATEIKETFRARVATEFIEPKRNVIRDEPVWYPTILVQMEDQSQITDYLVGILNEDPASIPVLLKHWVWSPLGSAIFRTADFDQIVSIDRLRAELTVERPEPTDDAERVAYATVFGPTHSAD